jgi:Family of unknown function (DUF5681)
MGFLLCVVWYSLLQRARGAPVKQRNNAMVDDRHKQQIGYGRPPKHTRFQPGKSGNPRGRPKEVRNFKTDLRDELREQIPVSEGGREIRISKQRAFIKALVAAAIKGDMRATNALVSFCTRTLGSEEQEEIPETVSTDDLEIIEAFVERERKRLPNNTTDTQSSSTKSTGERRSR